MQKIEAANKRIDDILKIQAENKIARSLPTDIPQDLQTFYKEMGYFSHPFTGKDVPTLAKHQQEAWGDSDKSKYRLYLKSQKIGLSMLFLLEDVHKALTVAKGQEILVVAQSKSKAQDHLQDIRKMLRASPKYKDYLIEDASKTLLRDEKTKIEIIYLRNPEKPAVPTKIIALGITSPSSLISFKKVRHIHMSDVTLADMSEERFNESFGALFSRLANTNGSMVIECPPRGTSGPVFDLVNANEELKDDEGITIDIKEGELVTGGQGFLIRRYTFQVGLDSGLMNIEFIDSERRRLSVLFGMYYEATFYSSDRVWFDKAHVKQTSEEATLAYGSF